MCHLHATCNMHLHNIKYLEYTLQFANVPTVACFALTINVMQQKAQVNKGPSCNKHLPQVQHVPTRFGVAAKVRSFAL